ncbi:MAG: redoxin domain-containing protein [Gemmatimonadales bacterium]|jgi:tetratricopeptide (TPR) repeat protein
MTASRLYSRLVRPGQSAALLATTFLLTGWLAQGAQDDVAAAAAQLRQLYLQRDYETAVREGAGWLERAPEAFELRAWYVLNLARDGKTDDAVAEAEAMVEADSADPWCWFALAGALNWHSERGEEALDASERALTMSPDHIDFIVLRAFVIRRQEGAAASVAFIDALPPEVREDPQVLVRKAAALHFLSNEEGDEAAAEESYAVFDDARAADPQNVEAYYLAGAYLLSDRRNDDAYPLLKRAAELSPSAEVHDYYWRAVMGRRDLSADEKRIEIEADVANLLERRSDSPAVLYAIAGVYGQLELEDEQREYEDSILELYPETGSAEWVLVSRIQAVSREMYEEKRETGVEDPEKRARYRQMLVEFIERPHHQEERLLGGAYTYLLELIKDEPDIDAGYLYEVVDGMVRYGSGNPTAFYTAAIALAEHKTHFEVAESLAAECAVGVAEMVESMRESGVYETEGEYQRVLDHYQSQTHDALGWVYFNQDRLDEAEEELLAAYDLNHESIQNLYHLGRLYETRYDLAVAAEDAEGRAASSDEAAAYGDRGEEYYIKGVMVQTPGESPNDEALKALYEKRHGTLDGYEDYLANAEEIDRQRRHEKILAERLEEPEAMEPFALETLSGLLVSSSFLRGRIVVINFWGTWCGWCVLEMPDIQEFHERYRDDRDVVVLTINNDDDPADVREWMTEHEYDFAVLLDEGYNDNAGVQAYPTTWFIDRQGRIAFQKRGWSEALTEEFGWRVEALRGSGGG